MHTFFLILKIFFIFSQATVIILLNFWVNMFCVYLWDIYPFDAFRAFDLFLWTV